MTHLQMYLKNSLYHTENGMVLAISSVMISPVKPVFRRSLAAAAFALAGFSCLTIPADARQPIEKFNALCTKAVQTEERRSGIPRRLLEAISSVEAGRWSGSMRANIAWPWTVTAEGEGNFYPSRQAAIRAVDALRQRGIRNIDVGCMQINLGYHPDAFESLDQAFDPVANVAYAAKFLKALRTQKRSWDKAVKFYHSSNPERQRYYGGKVYKARQEIRLRDAKQRRGQRIALTKSRRTAPKVADSGGTEITPGSVPLSYWPPRSYRAQRQLELRARNWAFNKRRN